MKFHTKLIGAFDAVILAAVALVTVGFAAALFDPPGERHVSVTADTQHRATQHV